jgi:hypothetical protein
MAPSTPSTPPLRRIHASHSDSDMALTTPHSEAQQALKKRVRHRSVTDGKHMYFGKYVSYEGSEKLLTYQYHGADNSLIYKHVLTPMNNYLVELLPLWLAPNLVRFLHSSLIAVSFATDSFFLLSLDHADGPHLRRCLARAVCVLLPVL